MNSAANSQTTIKTLATRVAAIRPRNHTEIALLGLMAGVLFSLERAIELDFDDARMKQAIDEERVEIRKTFEAIGHGRAPADPWLAGFYLNSAIMRLDTFYQRVSNYTGVKRKLAQEINRTNRFIKHTTNAGLEKGWNLRFARVIQSTERWCELLIQELR